MARFDMALIIATALAASCAAGCATSVQHGQVLQGSADDPFVTVEAGNVQFRFGRFYARYAVDRATHTCWLIVGQSLAQMDCCASRRVEALRDVITWESDASCIAPRVEGEAVRSLSGASGTDRGRGVDPGTTE